MELFLSACTPNDTRWVCKESLRNSAILRVLCGSVHFDRKDRREAAEKAQRKLHFNPLFAKDSDP